MATAGNLETFSSYDCAVCFDRFENPYLITCGHSFCGPPKRCLSGIIDSHNPRCPICQTKLKTEDFPKNFALMGVIEEAKKCDQETSRKQSLEETANKFYCVPCCKTVSLASWMRDHDGHVVRLQEKVMSERVSQWYSQVFEYQKLARKICSESTKIQEIMNQSHGWKLDDLEAVKSRITSGSEDVYRSEVELLMTSLDSHQINVQELKQTMDKQLELIDLSRAAYCTAIEALRKSNESAPKADQTKAKSLSDWESEPMSSECNEATQDHRGRVTFALPEASRLLKVEASPDGSVWFLCANQSLEANNEDKVIFKMRSATGELWALEKRIESKIHKDNNARVNDISFFAKKLYAVVEKFRQFKLLVLNSDNLRELKSVALPTNILETVPFQISHCNTYLFFIQFTDVINTASINKDGNILMERTIMYHEINRYDGFLKYTLFQQGCAVFQAENYARSKAVLLLMDSKLIKVDLDTEDIQVKAIYRVNSDKLVILAIGRKNPRDLLYYHVNQNLKSSYFSASHISIKHFARKEINVSVDSERCFIASDQLLFVAESRGKNLIGVHVINPELCNTE